jgi:hypothetical protein
MPDDSEFREEDGEGACVSHENQLGQIVEGS